MATMSRDIAVTLIDADANQPRRHFDPQALQELADNLVAVGQVVPITVRPVGERFVIVQGERRWRAAQLAGLATLRAEVSDIDADAAYLLALIENIQRADLTPLEEAKAFQHLLNQGITQTALAKRVGKTQSYIAQKVRLLKMPAPLQVFLEHGVLSEGHIRQILRLQAIYGEDIAVALNGDVMEPWSKGNLGDDPCDTVAMFTVGFRPVDAVWGIAKPSIDQIGVYRDAIIAFGKYCVECNMTPPSWVGTAMWFAIVCAHQHMSVVELHELIGHFEFLLYSSVVMLSSYAERQKTYEVAKMDEAGSLLYFSASSDLRHAGVPTSRDEIPSDFFFRAVKFCFATKDSYLFPSQFQPGGCHAELGATLTNPDREREMDMDEDETMSRDMNR
jgi:ParB/RepB/Spo0J family partition protein